MDRAAYRARLAEARAELLQGLRTIGGTRDQHLERARSLLRQTTALRLDDGATLAVDDAAIAARVDGGDASIERAIATIDGLSDLVSAVPVDLRAADARLRDLVGETRARDAQLTIGDLIARWLRDLFDAVTRGGPDPVVRDILLGGIGLAVLAFILAVLGRDIRERFRREVVLAEARKGEVADPAAHLRDADEHLRAGHLRDAVHQLYLFAIATLAAREMIRYDPSLTDRELLARATAVPHADALRELVRLHDVIWYGLHDARADDASRARGLAVEAVA